MSNARFVVVVLARMDSTRLPGKAMTSLSGRPLVGHVLARAGRIPNAAGVVLATTGLASDDVLAEYARRQGVGVYRGSEDDVAGRMLAAGLEHGATHIIRVNGDSPFVDPELIAEGISRSRDDVDFVTNLIGRTFPYGISVEIVRTGYYRRVYAEIDDARDREHPTSWIYRNRVSARTVNIESQIPHLKGARLVVDTPEDLKVMEQVAEQLGERVLESAFEETAELYFRMVPTP